MQSFRLGWRSFASESFTVTFNQDRQQPNTGSDPSAQVHPTPSTMEDAAAFKDETAVADSKTSSSCRKPSRRTKALLGMLVVAAAAAAAVLVAVLVHSRRSKRSKCPGFQPVYDLALGYSFIDSYDNDPFYFSVVRYDEYSYLYSYKHRDTKETIGPKILLLTDKYLWFNFLNAFSVGVYSVDNVHQTHRTKAYSFELTIGQNSSRTAVWSEVEDFYNEHNVAIDSSVVFVRFNQNATYKVFNDTVFFISYALTNDTLQVMERRDVDLSSVTLSGCGRMQQLVQENAEISAFNAQVLTLGENYRN
jgi:hypothetical protein